MSQGSQRGRFWDYTLVWKFWVFEERSGERFGCNTGKSKKLGKIGVKVRFGCKIRQIWKILISPKKTQIFQNMRWFQNPPGWEHIILMSRVSHRGRFWDCTLVWKIWVFEEISGEWFGCNSCKRKKLGKILVKVRFGSKISQILKIKISPKN